MPYEYRRLTPEQRSEVLRQRKEHGYPLHAPPHPFRQATCYFISAANYEHASIIASPERHTELETRLVETFTGCGADVAAWVILPNHYHALIAVDTFEQISSALKQIHGVTSREWNQADGMTGKRRVWYKFADRAIRNEGHYYYELNYIHYNPVKHGYVENAYDWPWTSIGNYVNAYGREWLREKWRAYPADHLEEEWDNND